MNGIPRRGVPYFLWYPCRPSNDHKAFHRVTTEPTCYIVPSGPCRVYGGFSPQILVTTYQPFTDVSILAATHSRKGGYKNLTVAA